MMRRSVSSDSRAGFTLVELLIVAAMIAILATIALPQLQVAVAKARAASALSDMNTVRLAAHEALAETGQFPAEAAFAVVPPSMAPYLPDGFSFNKGDIRYRWRIQSAAVSPTGEERGRFIIGLYGGDPRFLDALASMGNSNIMIVTPTRVHFWIEH